MAGLVSDLLRSESEFSGVFPTGGKLPDIEEKDGF